MPVLLTKKDNLIFLIIWLLQQQQQHISEGHITGELTTIKAANHQNYQKTVLDEFLLRQEVTQGTVTGKMRRVDEVTHELSSHYKNKSITYSAEYHCEDNHPLSIPTSSSLESGRSAGAYPSCFRVERQGYNHQSRSPVHCSGNVPQ